MPAFDQTMISDADLEILAKFLNSLTIADTAVVIPDEVRTHLEKAYDALTAGDKGRGRNPPENGLEGSPGRRCG